jgi:hypothetical protein
MRLRKFQEIGQHLNTGAKSSMTNKQTLRSGERLRRRVIKKIEDSTLKLKVSAISRGISNKSNCFADLPRESPRKGIQRYGAG